MLPTNDAFANAFQLLASTVRDFYSNRRPCLGATLKPALYNRGSFTEQLLGFRKFGDFLRAAEAAGYVQLSPTPSGDIRVLPAGMRVPELPSQPTSGSAYPLAPSGPSSLGSASTTPVRVRQDLWNAFNSFSVKWVYDPTADMAYKDPDAGGAWGTQALPPRPNLVQIPTGRDRVLEWMRSFANLQDPETKAQLSTALDGDAALYQFNNLVRSKGLQRSWGPFHIQRVLTAIEAWATSNGVHPKNVTSPLYWPVRPAPPQLSAPVALMASVPEPARAVRQPVSPPLTGRLESLIDDLIDELIRLRGLLQVVGPKRS